MPLSSRSLTTSVLLVLVFLLISNYASTGQASSKFIQATTTPNLYELLGLSDLGLKREVFNKAVSGWNRVKEQMNPPKSNLLSIADFSQSCNSKRLYVINMEKGELLFNTYVSHGRNSGKEFATSFGNRPESYKSSLGFYLTSSVYKGDAGLSLRLKGLEQGINHFAEQRGIVIHGASYVSENFIKKYGRLGRSQGCPVVPPALCKPIINCIKEGSCVFIFYPDSNYFKRSKFYN